MFLTFSNINVDTNDVSLGNAIFDISILDEFGSSVSKFDDSMKICFEEENSIDDNACLGYYDTDSQSWECEDECLDKEGSQYCGDTKHLTSFALLLGGGNNGNNGGCGDSDLDLVITWISIGFIAFAIFFVILGIAVIELRYRKADVHRARTLNRLKRDTTMALHNSTS